MAASNINVVVITGNLTRDPELRSLQSGNSVCSLRIASNSRRRDASGEWVDSGTLYLSVSCFRRLVPNVDASIGRGDPIIAYGQRRTNRYSPLSWRAYNRSNAARSPPT